MPRLDQEACGANVIHPDAVKEALERMPKEGERRAMLDILSAMADGTRLQILLALRDRELCVYDISAVLCLSQSAVSHQLRALKNVHCVKSRRSGKIVYYSLDDEHVGALLDVALSHVCEGR